MKSLFVLFMLVSSVTSFASGEQSNVISPDVEVAASVSEEASIDERINRIMAIMESEKERNIKLKKIAIELQSLGHLFNQLEKDGKMPVGEELEIIEDAVEQIVLSVKVLQEAI